MVPNVDLLKSEIHVIELEHFLGFFDFITIDFLYTDDSSLCFYRPHLFRFRVFSPGSESIKPVVR